MPPEILNLILTGGAAGALGWVLRLLTASKPGLHTASEVNGLRKDNALLLASNKTLGEALKASNETDAEILRLLRTLYAAVTGEETPDA